MSAITDLAELLTKDLLVVREHAEIQLSGPRGSTTLTIIVDDEVVKTEVLTTKDRIQLITDVQRVVMDELRMDWPQCNADGFLLFATAQQRKLAWVCENRHMYALGTVGQTAQYGETRIIQAAPLIAPLWSLLVEFKRGREGWKLADKFVGRESEARRFGLVDTFTKGDPHLVILTFVEQDD